VDLDALEGDGCEAAERFLYARDERAVDRVEKHLVALRVGKRGHFRRRTVLVEGQLGIVVDERRVISRGLIERQTIHPFKELLIAVQDCVDHFQVVATNVEVRLRPSMPNWFPRKA